MKKTTMNYQGMSYVNLAAASQRVTDFAKEDLNLLTSLGVTSELLEQLEEKIVALNAVESHQYVVGKKAKTTVEKNKSAKKLKQTMQELRVQTMFVESFSEEHYVAFHSSLRRTSVSSLLYLAKLMLDVMKNTDEDLHLFGVTDERIAAFEAQITTLYNNTVAQESKTVGLSDYTEDRHRLRAELTKLLYFVSGVGKTYWLHRSKARYTNYVVKKPKAPPIMATTDHFLTS